MNENIYNFDKIDFAINIITTAKVLIQADKCSHLSFIQFENQK